MKSYTGMFFLFEASLLSLDHVVPWCGAWSAGPLCRVRDYGCGFCQQCTYRPFAVPISCVFIFESHPAKCHTDTVDSVQNTSYVREKPFLFSVPGTLIKLHLSRFHGLLNQGELDLCIIEGLSKIFETVVAQGSDGDLPSHTWSTRWVNIIINIEDAQPPELTMTYGYLVSTLRGVALFASLYGYVEMDVEVYHDTIGYIGIGYLGQIIPSPTS